MTSPRPSNLLIRLLAPAFAALTAYMTRAGLIAFADEPAGGNPGDGAPNPDHGAALLDDTGTGDGKGADPAAGGDGKPAAGDGKPAGENKEPDKDGDKPALPEKYEFKVPEAFAIDEALHAEFDPLLRELNLTQEQAQKLVDFGPKFIAPAIDAAVAGVLKQIGYEGSKGWAAAAKADKEFGGDKWTESRGQINALLDNTEFVSPGLKDMVLRSPLGTNPEFLRLLHRVNTRISQDGYVPGGEGRTAEAKFYDNSPALK